MGVPCGRRVPSAREPRTDGWNPSAGCGSGTRTSSPTAWTPAAPSATGPPRGGPRRCCRPGARTRARCCWCDAGPKSGPPRGWFVPGTARLLTAMEGRRPPSSFCWADCSFCSSDILPGGWGVWRVVARGCGGWLLRDVEGDYKRCGG